MITQQIISSELEVLKKHIDSGDIRIPSLWQGLKPGLFLPPYFQTGVVS